MTWIGLRHKGFEILFPEEWNSVIDALDILYMYWEESVKKQDLQNISSDIVPSIDSTFNLGRADRRWLNLYAVNVFTGDLVLSDITCSICGERFREGDVIVFIVKKVSRESIDIVPAHLVCAYR